MRESAPLFTTATSPSSSNTSGHISTHEPLPIQEHLHLILVSFFPHLYGVCVVEKKEELRLNPTTPSVHTLPCFCLSFNEQYLTLGFFENIQATLPRKYFAMADLPCDAAYNYKVHSVKRLKFQDFLIRNPFTTLVEIFTSFARGNFAGSFWRRSSAPSSIRLSIFSTSSSVRQ